MKSCTKCGVELCEKNWRIINNCNHIELKCKYCIANVKSCRYIYPTEEMHQIAVKNSDIIKCKIYKLSKKGQATIKAYRPIAIIKSKQWLKDNKDRWNQMAVKRRQNLNNCYIKERLLDNELYLQRNDIPQELIELKRKQLITSRLIKQQNHGKN